MWRSMALVAALAAGSFLHPGSASADDATAAFSERIQKAMKSENRTPEETARDANRRPVETLAFAGLHGEMDVLELVPGGAWYTKLLAPSLSGDGSLSVWVGIDRFKSRLEQPGLEDVRIVAPEVVLEATERAPSPRRSAALGRARAHGAAQPN